MWRFYRGRKFSFAWYDHAEVIEQAHNLFNRAINLQSDGVQKVIPYRTEFDSLLHEVPVKSNIKTPDLKLELMLTSQYFVLANDAWRGLGLKVRDSASWYIPRMKVDYDAYLDSLLISPTRKFTAEEPVNRQYELLRSFLKKYRTIDSLKKWQPLAGKFQTLKPGDSSAGVRLLKITLFQLGDFLADTSDCHYGNDLSTALKQFQTRNGLPNTGTMNKQTAEALNVPVKSRIKQILVNMERSRWLPVSLNSDYLAVNIPEYTLHVYHANSLLWSCNVVVGQTFHKTTVFYGQMQDIVFSPYWYVPRSIILNEILPALKKRSSYLAKHNMEITGYLNHIPQIRQKPGPNNSLGLVKFIFPNSYTIYLHDTPAKSLFTENSRGFSHGCIRISAPARLARFLLRKYSNWDTTSIYLAMHAGIEKTVHLKPTVPVFITYFTAFADRTGLLNFRKDIYDFDAPLYSMMIKNHGR